MATTSRTTTKREDTTADGFTAEERAAMKERARELKAAKAGKKGADETQTVLDKIAGMPEPDRAMAQRVHQVVMEAAPELAPRLWYGMPAYAKDGKVLLFFQDAAKFKARYATLGFQDTAMLDDGDLWPTSFALVSMTKAVEKRIAALVKQAVG